MIFPFRSRLVMNKGKLPAILRNNVSPLGIGGTPVQPLIAARTNLWGILHSDVGKQIRHKGCSVTIVNVHRKIRQIEDADGDRFWISRRAGDKRKMRQQRIARQFAQGIRKIFRQPCWTGEPRPQAVSIPIENLYSIDHTNWHETMCFLCALKASLLVYRSAKETKLMSVATRLGNEKRFLKSLLAQKTKELTENLVIEHLRRSTMGEAKKNAVYEIISGGTAIESVARARVLDARLLKRTVRRIRFHIQPRVQEQLQKWMAGASEIHENHDQIDTLRDEHTALVIAKEPPLTPLS